MSDSNETELIKQKTAVKSSSMLLSVAFEGKDSEIWARQEPRFHQRIFNSLKKMVGQGRDIPASATANDDLKEAIDNVAQSAQEKLKGPQLINLERQANIAVKLAEAKEREANARKIDLEADKLEMEIERAKVHESQAVIELMFQRGELTLLEKDGVTYLVYSRARKGRATGTP